MNRRRPSRRRHARGFVLAEALVALTVAALTLALMTSATFGLRQAALEPNPLQQEATDWLTARRVLQAWAGSATSDGVERLPARFFGTPDQVRFVIDDGTNRSNAPVTIALHITSEDGIFTMQAARHPGARDVRLIGDLARMSTVIISDQPLRFVYQMQANLNANGRVWTYEPEPEQGLPTAIAIERGSDLMVMAAMPATRSIACMSRFGVSGLSEQSCEIR